jgi:hypothetical protein
MYHATENATFWELYIVLCYVMLLHYNEEKSARIQETSWYFI